MIKMPPAIVIPAYNRPHTLARLLASLKAANYPHDINIPLIISIDPENGVPNAGVREAAESFQWQYGPKEVVLHSNHLGLLNNFYFCGDLTRKFGSIIFLEDDSVVSPVFYYYAVQSLAYFEYDTRVTGISLYRYSFNGYSHYPFEPLADGSDVFFMQVSSIMGQVWNKRQWIEFEDWRITSSATKPNLNNRLHDVWSQFEADDHFPILTNYLVSTNRYFVFPRVSLTTGFGDAGTHFMNTTSYFQAPLLYGQTSFRLQGLDDSNSVYDSFMEIMPVCIKRLVPALHGVEFEVNLNAVKKSHHLTAEYVVTTLPCRNPVKTYALAMRPPEANLIFGTEGTGVSLCRRSDILWDELSELKTRKRLYDYFTYGRRSGLRQSFVYVLFDLINRFSR